jgi:hypothetical protein
MPDGAIDVPTALAVRRTALFEAPAVAAGWPSLKA